MDPQEIQTLNELFLKAVESRGRKPAFLVRSAGRYQPMAASEALAQTAALAATLNHHGVRRGERVALLAENRIEWALSDYAILGLGAVTVPLYPTLPESDVEYILRDADACGVIVSTREQLEKVLSVRSRLPRLACVMMMDDASGTPDVLSWSREIASERRNEQQAIERFQGVSREARPSDVATILYTSGTMGAPKGVVLTHSNIVACVLATERLFPLQEGDVTLSFLPLSHIFERMVDYFYLKSGATIAHAESVEALPKNLLEVRPTMMMVVPRVLEKVYAKVMERVRSSPAARQKLFFWAVNLGRAIALRRISAWLSFARELEPNAHAEARSRAREHEGDLPLDRWAARSWPPDANLSLAMRWKHAVADRLVFSKIRAQLGGRVRTLVSGAAPASPELMEFFFAMGLPVYEGYGLTETSPVISVNYPGALKIGTVGPVIQNVEVRLGDAEGDADEGSGREILVRGPTVTQGYYRLDEENRRAFRDGWFCTGDLGTLDADGFLTITGRKKNLLKTSGGKYVSPEKLENLFQGHAYVSQIVVLGDGRKFVGALVAPHFARLEAHAKSQGIAFPNREALVQHASVAAFLQGQVDEACQPLAPHERIRQIIVLPEELTLERGELSATLKVKRRVVEEKYRAQIEEMFERHAPGGEQSSSAAQG